MDRQAQNAHLISSHLRALGRLLHCEGATDAKVDGLWVLRGMDLAKMAEELEATAPFVPLTEDEKQEVFEHLVEEAGDQSAKETARGIIADWTEADWRMEKDGIDEYMKEDEDDQD